MTKTQHKRQALEAIDRAARLLASASHDYELGECALEFGMTYDLWCEVRDLHTALAKKRKKKARK